MGELDAGAPARAQKQTVQVLTVDDQVRVAVALLQMTQVEPGHLVDFARGSLDARQWQHWAEQGYDRDVVVGADLQHLTVK
ncbi:hypothetical protein GT031_14195 [Streptomyces sp. SID2888]|nr:hypothetical protein [Streptomyces sp. SID2888]